MTWIVNPSTVALIDVGASSWPSESKSESSIARAPSFSKSRFCKENEETLEQLQANGVHHHKVVRAKLRVNYQGGGKLDQSSNGKSWAEGLVLEDWSKDFLMNLLTEIRSNSSRIKCKNVHASFISQIRRTISTPFKRN